MGSVRGRRLVLDETDDAVLDELAKALAKAFFPLTDRSAGPNRRRSPGAQSR